MSTATTSFYQTGGNLPQNAPSYEDLNVLTRRVDLLFLALVVTVTVPPAHAADWSQWRGSDRSGVSPETGLLREWPPDGPPLVWKAEGLGHGVPPVSVAAGRVYVLGYRDNGEYLTALHANDGRQLWSVQVGPAVGEQRLMRWLSQRAPTVDGDRVYAFTASGELVCLETAGGKERWRKNYPRDFGGKRAFWGFCDFPLVDGNRLICTPGGDTATLVALDKRSGAIVWKCAVPGGDNGTHSAVVVTHAAGIRQYVQQFERDIVGVAAADGRFLWRYQGIARDQAHPSVGNVHTALVKDDLVFCSGGWGVGCALIKLAKSGAEIQVEELYRANHPFDSWLGGSVLLGGRVHTSEGMGIDLMTGELLARTPRRNPRITMACADGLLFHRFQDNTVTLTEVTAEGYVQKSTFPFPRFSQEPTWTTPVIAGGRLYLRDQEILLCYDIQKKPSRQSLDPSPIFVPSPQDVVEKMLELAKVNRDTVVYDLGCGDGRIVVTAAKQYGCKAVGIDIDPDCVKAAWENVKQNGVEGLVRIVQDDLFNADLSQADVVMLYLLPTVNVKLIPQLEKMKSGSRIISHAFDMAGVTPDQVMQVVSNEDGVERPLYLWTVPLKKEPE